VSAPISHAFRLFRTLGLHQIVVVRAPSLGALTSVPVPHGALLVPEATPVRAPLFCFLMMCAGHHIAFSPPPPVTRMRCAARPLFLVLARAIVRANC
jgi:hypothetical protein